jgi:glycosyltransferase involved in cell wall biosynthesis
MISVIVATRDRARLLASTLDELLRLDWPGCPFEILVVDNGSVDDTPAVVATAARRSNVPIVYLREAKPGKSHALNTAVAHGRGDLLAFTDDDVLPSPRWLAAFARAFSETGADFAAGRVLPLWEAPEPRWLSRDLYGVLSIVDGGPRRLILSKGAADPIMPIGANMAVRRRVIERVGGWNPDLGKLQGTLRTGKDHEFMLRMIAAGFIGVYEPEASVRYRVPAERLRLGYFQRWFRDNGAIEAGFEREYPTTKRYVFGVPRHLWREFAREVPSTARALLTWNSRRATTGCMRLAWFAGYLRGCWQSRADMTQVDVRSAGFPQNQKP